MKSAREGGVKSRAVEAIRKTGRWARRMPQNGLTGGGMPDVLVSLRHPRGRALWLEFKKPGEQCTKLQVATQKELGDSGFAVAVVHSTREALRAIEVAELDGMLEEMELERADAEALGVEFEEGAP